MEGLAARRGVDRPSLSALRAKASIVARRVPGATQNQLDWGHDQQHEKDQRGDQRRRDRLRQAAQSAASQIPHRQRVDCSASTIASAKDSNLRPTAEKAVANRSGRPSTTLHAPSNSGSLFGRGRAWAGAQTRTKTGSPSNIRWNRWAGQVDRFRRRLWGREDEASVRITRCG